MQIYGICKYDNHKCDGFCKPKICDKDGKLIKILPIERCWNLKKC